jgi:hypothetical protein
MDNLAPRFHCAMSRVFFKFSWILHYRSLDGALRLLISPDCRVVPDLPLNDLVLIEAWLEKLSLGSNWGSLFDRVRPQGSLSVIDCSNFIRVGNCIKSIYRPLV